MGARHSATDLRIPHPRHRSRGRGTSAARIRWHPALHQLRPQAFTSESGEEWVALDVIERALLGDGKQSKTAQEVETSD